jgi:hypothetical protein
MDINKIVSIIRTLKEEGMTTGSSGAVAGFSALSPAAGPNAGNTYPLMGGGVQKRQMKKIIGLGKGSRNRWKKPQSSQ